MTDKIIPKSVRVRVVGERGNYWYVEAIGQPRHTINYSGLRRGVEIAHELCEPGVEATARYVIGSNYGRWEVKP